MSINLSELCKLLNGELLGDSSIIIEDIAEVKNAQPGQITFISNKKYASHLKESKASAVIISREMEEPSIPSIIVEDPQIAMAKTLEYFHENSDYPVGIDANAVINESAVLGEGCYVGAGSIIKDGAVVGTDSRIMENVLIDRNVTIGENCVINPGANILADTTIGNRVEIGSGTVIGSEGFGYLPDDDKILKVPQVGRVIIEDDVSIGANCCVDRATMGITILRKGVKLDNLIQIAHNVEVGENTIIAAQTGIAGSTKVGSGVLIGGQSGLVGHINIGDGVQIAAKTAVMKSFPDKEIISGIPARLHKKNLVKDANLSRIPRLVQKIKDLENEIADIKVRLGEND